MRKVTYDKLINSLTILLYHTPYEQLTILDLCEHAGITRRTFYKKFKSIDALVQSFFLQIFYDYCYSHMEDESYFYSDNFIYTMVKIWNEYGDLFLSLEKWKVLEYLTKNNIIIISELIKEKCSDEFVINNCEYFIISTYATLANLCMSWLKNGKKETEEELVIIIKKFVYHNL